MAPTARPIGAARDAAGAAALTRPPQLQPQSRTMTMLADRYPSASLPALLLDRTDWHPFPRAAERAAWEALPDSVRQAHVQRGERALAEPWEVLPATVFLDFVRTGDRARYERLRDVRRGKLADLVIAECVEGRGRFVDAIVDGVWLTCEETYWGLPAHVGVQRAGAGLPDVTEPTVDLFAGETVSLLAWTLYLLEPQLAAVSPLVPARIVLEAQRRVLEPCLARDDFWWMGFAGRRVNNWNPWCNSNWLAAALLLETDPARRAAAVAKSMRSLDCFIEPYPRDGGCDEGPGYWGRAGASLFECLELLHSASNGAIDVYGEPLIQAMGSYICRVQIAGRYFVNFADAPAMTVPAPGVAFRYGQRSGDPDLVALGAWAARELDIWSRGVGDSIQRQLPLLFALDELAAVTPAEPLPRDAWFGQIQVMVARDRAGSSAGLCVAAKGGHNGESHNHNDVGNFVVYVDGAPALVDAGVERYTAKTFSGRRYEIWTMQSAYHNLPAIGGVQQAPGEQYAARAVEYRSDDGEASLQLDLGGAYPEAAHLDAWVRRVTLRRGTAVEITDRFVLRQAPPELALALLTPSEVEVEPNRVRLLPRPLGDGRLSARATMELPPGLVPRVETIELTDAGLARVWGQRLFRIWLVWTAPPLAGEWKLRIAPGGR